MLLSDTERKSRIDSIVFRINNIKNELSRPDYLALVNVDGLGYTEHRQVKQVDNILVEKLNSVVDILGKDSNLSDYQNIEFRFSQMDSLGSGFYCNNKSKFAEIKSDIKTLYLDYNKDFREQQEKQSGCAITLAFMVVGATMYFLGGIKFFETILENISQKDSHASKVMHERSGGYNYLSR